MFFFSIRYTFYSNKTCESQICNKNCLFHFSITVTEMILKGINENNRFVDVWPLFPLLYKAMLRAWCIKMSLLLLIFQVCLLCCQRIKFLWGMYYCINIKIFNVNVYPFYNTQHTCTMYVTILAEIFKIWIYSLLWSITSIQPRPLR